MAKLFSDKNFNKKMLSMTLPMAFQQLMLAAVAAADAIMLGRLDQNSMAAVSLATQVQFVMNMFLGAMTGAGAILGAQYWGKDDRKSVDDIFWIMLRIVSVIDVLFFFLCVFCPQILMAFFTNDAVLADIGMKYLRIAGWSYLLVGFSQCYQAVMKFSSHAMASAVISTSAVIINIVMNLILIFGLIGAPQMGAQGAAAATLISRIIELAVSVLVSFRHDFVRPVLNRIFHRNRQLSHDFVVILYPLLGASLLWGIGFTSYTAIMGHLGADAAAANSVTAVVRDLCCCMCNGVANATSVLLGYELGQGNVDTAREYGERIKKLSFLIGFVTMAVVLLLIHPVLRFYRLGDTAKGYLTTMLVITAVYMIGRCINTVVINGIFAGGGDTKFDMYSNVVMMWCYGIPLTLIAAFVLKLPVVVVYAFTCLDEMTKIPWVFYHYRKYRWLKNLTRDFTSDR